MSRTDYIIPESQGALFIRDEFRSRPKRACRQYGRILPLKKYVALHKIAFPINIGGPEKCKCSRTGFPAALGNDSLRGR